MTKRKRTPFDSTQLRKRAIEVLGKKSARGSASEGALTRDKQELDIHRVELDLQNEELRRARSELETALDRYVQLFDFAPIGYATVSADGSVREMNHVGAGLLYERRSRLMGKRF